MRVYIAGPISLGGRLTPDEYAENVGRFHEAACLLRAHGYDVLSPVEGQEEASWADYMRRGIGMVLAAEAIVMLPRWEESRGARLERHVAKELGMAVLTIAQAMRSAT